MAFKWLLPAYRFTIPGKIWRAVILLSIVEVEDVLLDRLRLIMPYQEVDQCFLPALFAYPREPDTKLENKERS